MAQKLDTTPDGIICSRCHQDKPLSHFFLFRGKYDKSFFAAGIPMRSDVCWDCGGDYRCIVCETVQPPTAFRIGGRICKSCKSAGRVRKTATPALNSDFDAIQATEAIEGLKTPESADYE